MKKIVLGFFIISSVLSCSIQVGSTRYKNIIYNSGFVDDENLILTSASKEFDFYDLKSGETIADIGCGSAWLEGYLSIRYDSLIVYAQDINKKAIKRAHFVIDKYSELDQTVERNEIHYVLGTSTETLLPNHFFDKIIIRETFHHFENKNAVLKDIYDKLKMSGCIYVYEPKVERTEYNEQCKSFILNKSEIIKCFKENGFELEDEFELRGNPGNVPPWFQLEEQLIEDKIILKFKKSKVR